MIQYSRPEQHRKCSNCMENDATVKISLVRTEYKSSASHSFYLCGNCADKMQGGLYLAAHGDFGGVK